MAKRTEIEKRGRRIKELTDELECERNLVRDMRRHVERTTGLTQRWANTLYRSEDSRRELDDALEGLPRLRRSGRCGTQGLAPTNLRLRTVRTITGKQDGSDRTRQEREESGHRTLTRNRMLDWRGRARETMPDQLADGCRPRKVETSMQDGSFCSTTDALWSWRTNPIGSWR